MATNSYVTPGTPPRQQDSVSGVPKSNQQIVDPQTGIIRSNWWRFFQSISTSPQPEMAVVLGASPTTFTATSDSQVLITGGTVSSVTYTRKGTYNLGFTSGFFPMSIGDSITITYTVAPTVVYFPC